MPTDSKPSSAPVPNILTLGTKRNFSFQEAGKWEVRKGKEKCGEGRKEEGHLGAPGVLAGPIVTSPNPASHLETRHCNLP